MIQVKSLKAMGRLAQDVAARLKRHSALHPVEVALIGDLGTGKTTFVGYFAAQMGACEAVSSPSYVLQHEYHCAGGITLEHWDLYRLSALPDELREPAAPRTIRIVEWADRSAEYTNQADLRIEISFLETNHLSQKRKVDLSGALAPKE